MRQAPNAGRVLRTYNRNRKPKPARLDIDEEAFRDGRLSAKLYGLMTVLVEPRLMQSSKDTSAASDDSALEGMAQYVVEEMTEDTAYIVGSGSTTRAVMREMNLEGTLLGRMSSSTKKLS